MILSGNAKDDVVVCSGLEFDDRGDLVARRAKSGDHAEVATLIREEAHGLFPVSHRDFVDEDDFFVGERVSSVTHGRLDIVGVRPG